MRSLFLFAVLGLVACAHSAAPPVTSVEESQEESSPVVEPAQAPEAAPSATPSPDPRTRIVEAARAMLGRPFSGDCSGFVKRALREAGVEFAQGRGQSGSESLYRGARAVKRPRPGDLAVFHDTYDRNGDGRWNDRFSHIALVERVEGARVSLIHRGGEGIARIEMNLSRPNDPAENSVIRKGAARKGRKRLTGQLFAGYGTLLPADEPSVARR